MATNAHIVDGHVPGIDLAIRAASAGSPAVTPLATSGLAATANDSRSTRTASDLILVELRATEWSDRAFAWPFSPVPGQMDATEPNPDVRDEDEADR